MKIRAGDNVMMLSGKDRGKSGKILRVLPKESRVVVEGLNLVRRHQRPKRQGQKGEVVSAPRAIDASSVALICGHCKKASRMGIKREGKKSVRVCKKCQAEN